VAGYDAAIFLDKERARFVPYATGSALPMPHRTSGTSIFDLLYNVQDTNTTTLRQMIHSQHVGNNSRFGVVEGEANMQDVLESMVIRMRTEGAVFPIPFNDVGPSCIQTLNYMNQVATSRVGAAQDLQKGEFQIAGTSAAAAVGEIGHKEKMSAYFARNIIETIVKGAYGLIHNALRSYFAGPIDVRINGQWVQSDPRRWRVRSGLRVIAGLSESERTKMAMNLEKNIQFQSMGLQAGMDGTLVTPDGVHNSLADWLRAVDLGDVNDFYVDPQSEEAQQASQAKQQQQQQAQEKQAELEKGLVQAPLALDKYKADQDDAFKRWNALLDAQVQEMKITGKAVADMEQSILEAELDVEEDKAEAAA
jgi:hypothetical protein